MKYLLIGLGGFLGANLRYIVQSWSATRWGDGFPYGTLLANVTGSFVLGFFITIITQHVNLSSHWRPFLAIGVLGGYTTFSSLTVETLGLMQSERWLTGGVNLFGNVFLGLLAALAGIGLARAL